MQPESQPLDRDEFLHATNRCIQAYLDVKAKLPKKASWSDTTDNDKAACAAYLTELPLLCDPQSFQLYIACIAKGASIGVIDPVDVGRYCHLAQTAMSAWKLANLTVPAAQRNEKEATQKSEKEANPLPSKGNQYDDIANIDFDKALQEALNNLPPFDIQKMHFLLLRNRGHILPSDPELRDNPLAALHFCREAQRLIRQEALAGIELPPAAAGEPAPDKPGQPKQVA